MTTLIDAICTPRPVASVSLVAYYRVIFIKVETPLSAANLLHRPKRSSSQLA